MLLDAKLKLAEVGGGGGKINWNYDNLSSQLGLGLSLAKQAGTELVKVGLKHGLF